MSALTDQEEYGEDAGGEEPGPVDVVEDVVRVQPQVRDGEVQLLHRHVVLREHFKIAPYTVCLPTFILRHFSAVLHALEFLFLLPFKFPIPTVNISQMQCIQSISINAFL